MQKINLLNSLILIVFFSVNISAQIIYTDIPDGQPAGLDFNQDGTVEFNISTEAHSGDYIEYIGIGTDNNIHAVGDQDDAWDVPSFVEEGFTINETNNWIGQGDAYPNGDYSSAGNNPTVVAGTDQYMAVRFNLGGTDKYYGWVRVKIDASGNVTFKDYAYQSTPSTEINAGDTGATAGIADLKDKKSFSIYPNPAKDIITINNELEINISKIEIIDLLGKKVKEIEVLNTNNQIIDISGLNKGVYFISMFENGKRIGQKKLIID